MDLITVIATELGIPIMRPDQKIWFLRTKSGAFYFDFILNNFIALGWDLVSPEMMLNSNLSREALKERIAKLYPDEKRPGLILSQVEVFYSKMQLGDLVIIPSEGGKQISIGRIGRLTDEVIHKKGLDYSRCEFIHKRDVEWLKTVDSYQDIYLFKTLRAQQTISDMTTEGKLVYRNLFPVYIAGDAIHFTFHKKTKSDLNLASNVAFLSNLLTIMDATSDLYHMDRFNDDISIKTAVGSPGVIEMILPNIPVAVIAVGLLANAIIGKEKSPDGSIATGILAIISKVNDLVNDYHNRKKTDAEVKQIQAVAELTLAQAEKAKADAQLSLAQAAKANAEARALELENQQIAITKNGKTTEEVRTEQELLSVPEADEIRVQVQIMADSGDKVCNAAVANGISFGGESIDRAG